LARLKKEFKIIVLGASIMEAEFRGLQTVNVLLTKKKKKGTHKENLGIHY
jgi:hypothetical protein